MRIGRRGAILLAAAWINAWLGWTMWVGIRTMPLAAVQMWPSDRWAILWAITAAVCVGSALASRDAWGFVCAATLGGLWALFYALSWLTVHDGALVAGVAIWTAWAFVMVTCAGWREG